MKKVVYIFLIIFCACDKEDASNCFQTEGELITQEFAVTEFQKILVNRDVELIISQGDNYSVIVETGSNLLNDIEVSIVGNELQLTNNNDCNYFRNYGVTKIYVTTPVLREIRSSTQFDISSEEVLDFQNLKLISEDYSTSESFTVGDFKLSVSTNTLSVVSNNISSFYIEGDTEELFLSFYSGTGRFEGQNLISNHVEIFHRGSNDMLVHPIETLSGELRGTGDLISVNQPASVNVEQYYTGQLILQ